MCGINGFIDFTHRSSKEILIKGTDVLLHRGPDGSGYEFFENGRCQVGLGHRRLSIIDLSDAAAQPMWYKHYCIVFNGEIYNHALIRQELEALGHRFLSHSDTEVILHAWEEWGEKMISRFRGMFALVIYDKEKEELFMLRDRVGVKPFYYYHHEGLFLFSSELKSFHKHPFFRRQLDEQAVYQYLQYGYIMAPLCIFKHTFKLLPGHFIQFRLREDQPEIKKYWDIAGFYSRPRLKIDMKEAAQETERLLTEASRYRMVSDVPVGVFLSGGYDSTMVTALLQRTQQEKLRTFTIGLYDDKLNEAPAAKKIASYLGTNHTEYYCTTREAQEIIPKIPFICDEPSGDPSIIPTALVSSLARKDVTVALSADGGDELFGGYTKYSLAMDFLRKIEKIPFKKSAGRLISLLPARLLESFIRHPAFLLKKERISSLLQDPEISSVSIMDRMLSQTFSDEQMHTLFTENVTKPLSFFDRHNGAGTIPGSLDQMLALDYITYLPYDILYKVDAATMSASLEGREPMLDHILTEFVAQLPPDLKIKNGEKKYLLKQIASEYLPPELMNRPKMGFGIPVSDWLKKDLRPYVEKFMSEEAFKKHGLFTAEGIRLVKENFFRGNKSYDHIFWYLFVFQMWYDYWME